MLASMILSDQTLFVSDSPTFANIEVAASGYAYITGDESTNGSWRIGKSGNNQVIQNRRNGNWDTLAEYEPKA